MTITKRSGDITPEQILSFLPHGSGINGDWQVDENTKYWLFINYFHARNKDGVYDGYCDFTLKVPKKGDVRDFKLTLQGAKSHYLNIKYQLREYLQDLFAERLSHCEQHYNESLDESTFKPPLDI